MSAFDNHSTLSSRTLNVGDMACSGCAQTVREALEAIEGVTKATVDLAAGTASVTYEPGKVSVAEFERTIQTAGYKFKGVNE